MNPDRVPSLRVSDAPSQSDADWYLAQLTGHSPDSVSAAVAWVGVEHDAAARHTSDVAPFALEPTPRRIIPRHVIGLAAAAAVLATTLGCVTVYGAGTTARGTQLTLPDSVVEITARSGVHDARPVDTTTVAVADPGSNADSATPRSPQPQSPQPPQSPQSSVPVPGSTPSPTPTSPVLEPSTVPPDVDPTPPEPEPDPEPSTPPADPTPTIEP